MENDSKFDIARPGAHQQTRQDELSVRVYRPGGRFLADVLVEGPMKTNTDNDLNVVYKERLLVPYKVTDQLTTKRHQRLRAVIETGEP
ncbi:hypothetical protein BH09BAC4_BH09BAC4_14740 [soil metagenome]